MYASPSANKSAGGDTGNLVSKVSELFAGTTDMTAFGGQARCPECRCMQSSLMEVAKGSLATTFPSYGAFRGGGGGGGGGGGRDVAGSRAWPRATRSETLPLAT